MPFLFHQTPLAEDGTMPALTQPGTEAGTFNPLAIRAVEVDARQFLMIWACHARPNHNDNPPVVAGRGFDYSSIGKANLATIAKIRAAFVSQEAAQAVAVANGLHYVAWDDTAALVQCPVEFGRWWNVAYCPPTIKDVCSGYVLDYEVHDGRSRTVTANLFRRLQLETPDVTRYLYTNQRGSGGYFDSGLVGIETSTAWRFDAVSIFQDRNERLLASQLVNLGAQSTKAYVTFDLATNNLSTAQYVKSTVQQKGLKGVLFWRNGADYTLPGIQAKIDLFQSWV